VVVRVRDAGLGMDEQTRRRIFEPFFTTKPQGHGTGLGLPAVLGTVLQSGGAIDVRSEPGMGTEFLCYFPRLSNADAVGEALPRPSAELRSRPARRVLVVEDDPHLGKILRRLLQEGGHAVRLAATADEAEALAAAEAIDVLVCDQNLPAAKGSTLSGRLCARGAARGTVLISGRPIEEADRDEAGPRTTVLLKPFRPQQLLDVIEEIATGRPSPR
jgi:two-component system cell cycle sensor histidine kinase/response regulator CckA